MAHFIDVLQSTTPADARAMDLYQFLPGDWNAEVRTYDGDGTRHVGSAEIHAAWVLEGRAIQDVWMIPRLSERTANVPQLPVAGNWYGTTLRVYDPAQDAWRIFWIDPATQRFVTQTGRRSAEGVEQLGQYEDGSMSRWTFGDITERSFHWQGARSADGGKTWKLVVELFAKRFD
jgi:hypothetical protein